MRCAWLILLLSACEPPATTTAAFIALDRDFQGFEQWESHSFEGAATDVAHPAGPRTVYINQRPTAGSTSFAQGTIIVKVMDFTIFAMAKRGETYNAAGAVGWEWFELLKNPTTGAVTIQWRGVGPPMGEQYGKSGATCNQCHMGRTSNDSVMSPPLQLLSP